jgi:hypothetical protein
MGNGFEVVPVFDSYTWCCAGDTYIGSKHHWITEDMRLETAHGVFTKIAGSTQAHLMAEKMPILWGGVGVDYITTDCEAAMIKLGRILDVGKRLDAVGPAMEGRGIKHNGCVAHRLDKLYGIIADDPQVKTLLDKLASISTHLHKSSQASDYFKEVAKVAGGDYWTAIQPVVATRWWSLFSHISSFLANKEVFIFLRDAPRNAKSNLIPPDVFKLDDYDWGDLEVLKEMLEPFKIAQEKLEGSQYVTSSLVIPVVEEIRCKLQSTLEHYDSDEAPTSVTLLQRVITGFNLRFGDGSHICELKEGPKRQPCGYTPEQVVAACLDPRNVPNLPGIPPAQQDQAWALVRSMLVEHISHERDVGKEDVLAETEHGQDWLATASAAAAASSIVAASQDSIGAIADAEIKLWRMRALALSADKCPLDEWRKAVTVCPWLGSLARKVLAIPATSAAPERLFSTAGNTMTKKRCRLTCANLEELVYLHETWPKVRKWDAEKRMRVEESEIDLTAE